jgi:hypothetical protein
VFDEADRLFEMGFAEQLRAILREVPDSRQTMLVSATMPSVLAEFARAGLQEPQVREGEIERGWFGHTALHVQPAFALAIAPCGCVICCVHAVHANTGVTSQSNKRRRQLRGMTGGAAGHGDTHLAGPRHVVPSRAHGGEGACPSTHFQTVAVGRFVNARAV